MRALIVVISVLLIATLIWSETSAGELLPTSADGWHTWQVDEPGTVQVYVKVVNGILKDVRAQGSNCWVSIDSEVKDHGLVSAEENLDWFRTIIESKHLDMDVREEALFGLVQTESDAAFAYLDRLLTQN